MNFTIYDKPEGDGKHLFGNVTAIFQKTSSLSPWYTRAYEYYWIKFVNNFV